MEDARRGVYIRKSNGKFRVEHRYMPTPDIDQPSTFDDEVTDTVGKLKQLKRPNESSRNMKTN